MTCLPASIGREFGDVARVVVGTISRPLFPKKSSKTRRIGCGLIEAETIERVVTRAQLFLTFQLLIFCQIVVCLSYQLNSATPKRLGFANSS
jgi:hypothetical protein